MRKNSLKNMVYAALFASIIAVFTAWLFHIPIVVGANTAYLHFGDSFIFLAASLLPTSYACAAAAVGGGLADLLCGSAIWAPFTVVIKLLMALFFSSKSEKIISKRNVFALVLALIVTVVGYYLAEWIIYGNFIAPIYSVLGNVVQIVGSAVIYFIVGKALEKAKIKKFF